MTRRRFASLLAGLGVATTIVWTSLGTVVPAAGQPSIEIRSNLRGTDRPPVLDAPLFLLALGSDARDGTPLEDGDVDAIHIIGIDPVSGQAGLLGIPRTTYVRIAGHGFDELAVAARFGGAELMTRTVERLSGCRFEHTILAGFDGFRRLVDDIGGIRFDVPQRLRERGGSNIDLQAGTQRLDGAGALAWSRLRKGQTRPRGDRSRDLAQQELLLAALREARGDFTRSPGALLRMLAAFRRHVEHDLELAEMLRLGQGLLRIAPGAVRRAVVDAQPVDVAGRGFSRITKRGEEQFVDLCGDGILEPVPRAP